MAFLDIIDERVPELIRVRVKQMREEVDAINDAAMANFVTEIPRRISFKVSGNSDGFVDGDLMSADERAQAVSFVVRFNIAATRSTAATLKIPIRLSPIHQAMTLMASPCFGRAPFVTTAWQICVICVAP